MREKEGQILMSIELSSTAAAESGQWPPSSLAGHTGHTSQAKTLQIPVKVFSNLKFANLTWGPTAGPSPYWIRRVEVAGWLVEGGGGGGGTC